MTGHSGTPVCDGLCVYAADVGVPAAGVAYAHPGCPLHDPGEVCECGQPDRCLSPTHGQITMAEALRIRHSQGPRTPDVDEYHCCALDDGHDGPCAWVCPDCHGSTYCWACGGPSGDDLGTGCGECDGTGYCHGCYEGMVVDEL